MGSSTRLFNDDTIAAIATPRGEGAIGIVRLSGPVALAIVRRMFVSTSGRDIADDDRRVFHGHIVARSGEVLDEVLVHVMRAPHSYTREDVVEINGHGGPGPLQAILEEILTAGARPAGPGEFTKRAFLNGRIDLVQAEAVIDRIRSRTRAALRASAAAAAGALSRAIVEMKETLVEALARIEAAVDFPDDDLPDLVDETLRQRLVEISVRMRTLLATADAGRLYREGAGIAIAGRPNVGKSSLFNELLRDARAIVSEIPGTTRDRIEETVSLSGIPVRLTDTAGLRATDDAVERIGVDIARDAVAASDLVLFVVDASRPLTAEDRALAMDFARMERPIWLALNKCDLLDVPPKSPPDFGVLLTGWTAISATTAQGLNALERGLAGALLGGIELAPDQASITRAHQRDSLRRSVEALDHLLGDFSISPELLGLDLRDAVNALGEITGETTAEDLLDRIFSSFCIGK